MHPNTMSASVERASVECASVECDGYVSTVAFVVVLSNVLLDIPRIVWIVGDVVYCSSGTSQTKRVYKERRA